MVRIIVAAAVALAAMNAAGDVPPPQRAKAVPAGMAAQGGVPSDFVDETFSLGWTAVVGITFADDGRMFGWEREGLLWPIDGEGNRTHDPLLDLREEIESTIDRGLMSVALDPDFLTNGHIYLLYQVDRHHLDNFGTGAYDPLANDYDRATIGRITRYTADAATDFQTIVPGSRLILLGETASTGFPIVSRAHGLGHMMFGHDGSLLISCGDAAGFSQPDTGGPEILGSFAGDALASGIIQAKEDVGSFRSQLVDSLNGKIIRINPTTGDGLDDNPFYDKAAPRSARSRVWALGFRNPFRFDIAPEPDAPLRGAGPGVIMVSDVGAGQREDLHMIESGGGNHGWPLYEGYIQRGVFYFSDAVNLDAPNPLFDGTSCTQEFFHFRDLFIEDSLDPNPTWPNPCDAGIEVPPSLDRFMHGRPVLAYSHGDGFAEVGVYTGNNADTVLIDDPASPIAASTPFGGNAIISGSFYSGDMFPVAYQGVYFFTDFVSGWLRYLEFDGAGAPTAVQEFGSAQSMVMMAVNPADGALYYIAYPNAIRRIRYTLGNQPPAAAASADQAFGAAPLTVQFTGSGSSDPENLPLSYAWDFGDGSPINTSPDPTHVFSAPAGVPTRFDVTLTVTDAGGETSSTSLIVSANNTPPVVDVTSPLPGTAYSVCDGDSLLVDLIASVNDAEHTAGEIICDWRTILHHNIHQHESLPDPNCITASQVEALGCGLETYWYRFRFTATDAAGLATTIDIELFPDCEDCPADIVPPQGNGIVNIDDLLNIIKAFGQVCDDCPADIAPVCGNNSVNIDDLLQAINTFGPCD